VSAKAAALSSSLPSPLSSPLLLLSPPLSCSEPAISPKRLCNAPTLARRAMPFRDVKMQMAPPPDPCPRQHTPAYLFTRCRCPWQMQTRHVHMHAAAPPFDAGATRRCCRDAHTPRPPFHATPVIDYDGTSVRCSMFFHADPRLHA